MEPRGLSANLGELMGGGPQMLAMKRSSLH